jgi:hypothetical protein
MIDKKSGEVPLARGPRTKLSKSMAGRGLSGRFRRLLCLSTPEAHPKPSIMERHNGQECEVACSAPCSAVPAY